MAKEQMLTLVIHCFGFEHENTIWFAGKMETCTTDELGEHMDWLLDGGRPAPTEDEIEDMLMEQGA